MHCLSSLVFGALFAAQPCLQAVPASDSNKIAQATAGSPTFAAMQKKARANNCPIVIYITGSSWCPHCNTFTKEFIDTPGFQKAAKSDFVFWKVDTKITKDTTSDHPNAITFIMVPEEAKTVVGPCGRGAPYEFLGPPTVMIISPDGKLLRIILGKGEASSFGKPLEAAVMDIWTQHKNKD